MNKKLSPILTIAVAAALICILAFALVRIAVILSEKDRSEQVTQQLVESAVTERPKEQQEPELPAQERPAYPVPIEVDFESLKQQMPDIRGWIYCPDTPIHYPVVQGEDNRYYLRHLVTGQPNHGGSIFLDRRNPSDLTGKYNLIHGHNLRDDTMFGTLPKYREQEYYDAHKVVYLLTPDENYVIELFAGFTADSDDKIYTIPLLGKERMEIAKSCIARSDFVSQVQPQEDDQLMILSTCAYDYDDARYAVIGVMRKN